jgi:hypothetical protein
MNKEKLKQNVSNLTESSTATNAFDGNLKEEMFWDNVAKGLKIIVVITALYFIIPWMLALADSVVSMIDDVYYKSGEPGYIEVPDCAPK